MDLADFGFVFFEGLVEVNEVLDALVVRLSLLQIRNLHEERYGTQVEHVFFLYFAILLHVVEEIGFL